MNVYDERREKLRRGEAEYIRFVSKLTSVTRKVMTRLMMRMFYLCDGSPCGFFCLFNQPGLESIGSDLTMNGHSIINQLYKSIEQPFTELGCIKFFLFDQRLVFCLARHCVWK